MSVAVAVQRVPPPLLVELRAACKALNFPIEEWTGGILRKPPLLIVSALEPGERRLPEDLCQLIDSSPGARAVVCANEPLVKPRITLGNGRVVLLAPPVDRVRLIAVFRAAIGADHRIPPQTEGSRRFELLRRSYWVAWARGSEAAPIAINEQDGLTVAIGTTANLAAVTRTLTEQTTDAKRGEKLAERYGESLGLVHLVEDSGEWVIYWPSVDSPIWISSPQRLPTRWNAAKALAASNRLIRIPAFPGDQIVAAWSKPGIPDDLFAPVRNGMLEGGPETLGNLATATQTAGTLAGVVVELR